MVDGCLFTGSADASIIQWDVSTGDSIRTFHEHSLEVTSLAVADGLLYSGSDDGTAKQQWVTWSGGQLSCIAVQNKAFTQKISSLYSKLGSVANEVERSRQQGGGVALHIHDEEELLRLQAELQQMKKLLVAQSQANSVSNQQAELEGRASAAVPPALTVAGVFSAVSREPLAKKAEDRCSSLAAEEGKACSASIEEPSRREERCASDESHDFEAILYASAVEATSSTAHGDSASPGMAMINSLRTSIDDQNFPEVRPKMSEEILAAALNGSI